MYESESDLVQLQLEDLRSRPNTFLMYTAKSKHPLAKAKVKKYIC